MPSKLVWMSRLTRDTLFPKILIVNEENCLEIANVIAHIYDKATGPEEYADLKNDSYLPYFEAPIVLHIQRSLSETEMARALAIIVTLKTRLIARAGLALEIDGWPR